MPTANPRINVTLSPGLFRVVSRMAVATRVSKSQVLRELLEAAEPALQQVVVLMESAQGMAQALKGDLAAGLERAVVNAEAASAQGLAELNQISLDLDERTQEVRGRRPRAAPEATTALHVGEVVAVPQNPPPSNRGVKSTTVPIRRGKK